MAKEVGKLLSEENLEKAKQQMEELEANNKLGELQAKLQEYEEKIKKQEQMISEYAELNSKLFLRVGNSMKQENEEPTKSPEELEQEALLKSAHEKIEAINNGADMV